MVCFAPDCVTPEGPMFLTSGSQRSMTVDAQTYCDSVSVLIQACRISQATKQLLLVHGGGGLLIN